MNNLYRNEGETKSVNKVCHNLRKYLLNNEHERFQERLNGENWTENGAVLGGKKHRKERIDNALTCFQVERVSYRKMRLMSSRMRCERCLPKRLGALPRTDNNVVYFGVHSK